MLINGSDINIKNENIDDKYFSSVSNGVVLIKKRYFIKSSFTQKKETKFHEIYDEEKLSDIAKYNLIRYLKKKDKEFHSLSLNGFTKVNKWKLKDNQYMIAYIDIDNIIYNQKASKTKVTQIEIKQTIDILENEKQQILHKLKSLYFSVGDMKNYARINQEILYYKKIKLRK